MDTLSDVLYLLRPRCHGCGGVDLAGEISIDFPRHEGIKCYSVAEGEAWLAVEGVAEPVRLREGDCFILPKGLPFRIASDLALPPVDYRIMLAEKASGTVKSFNGGGECLVIAGHFSLEGEPANTLLSPLQPIIHIRSEPDRAAMRWSLDRMMREFREPRPGNALIMDHLAHMLLVQGLRLYAAEEHEERASWLFAMADKRIGAAISALHQDPSRRWTVAALANHAGMSRTSFSVKFRAMAGLPPIEYLTRWRMVLAADRLTNSGDMIADIALSLGYGSESAFSTAFKRAMGHSPRSWVGSNPRKVQAA